MVCKILIAFLYIIAKLLNIFQKILVTHNTLLWFSFFRYIWSIEYIKIYSKHVSSAYSTISKWNIKESLLGTFCIFSYRHETFNAVYVFLTIGKVRFWLVSGQRIVDLQNAQCILDFFWKHLIFIIYWVKVFEKTLQNFIILSFCSVIPTYDAIQFYWNRDHIHENKMYLMSHHLLDI